jgi:hypothetical protein
MAKWKSGDRVRIVTRAVTKEDRATNSYYEHLAGLAGTVTQAYNRDEIAVKIDPDAFTPAIAQAHKEAVKRMRLKFIGGLSEEQKRKLSKEEKQFDANYVLLLHSDDLEKGPPAPKKVVKSSDEDEDLESYEPTSVVQGALYDDPDIAEGVAKRPSLADLDATEQAELERRRN